MKHAVRLLTTASALALTMTASAFAADLHIPEVVETPVYHVPEHVPVDVSGWYIRGDLGYSWNKIDDIHYVTYGTPGGSGTLTGELKESFHVGVGVGYQVNHYFRTDVTVDYDFKTDFHGSTDGFCTTGGATVACSSTDVDGYKAWTVLANAYFDFGTYAGFTPYVGAGIGGSYVTWHGLENTIGGGFDQSGTITHEGSSDWRFAYALMVGASYDINARLAVDVGYRYRKIHGARMFQYAAATGPGYDSGFESHQVRAGLRYRFGGKTTKHLPPPPTLPPVYK